MKHTLNQLQVFLKIIQAKSVTWAWETEIKTIAREGMLIIQEFLDCFKTDPTISA